jgi:hypothetical protein
MPQLQAAIVGHNNTRAAVTGQEELLVRVNSVAPGPGTVQDVNIVGSTLALGIKPNIIISSGDVATLIPDDIFSISFASNGTANALITFDGGATYINLAAGTTVNMDAGGLNNFYLGNIFGYDTATNSGASLIITFNSL